MFGLSTDILQRIDNERSDYEDRIFTNMEVLNKVIRWKRKKSTFLFRPSFKEQAMEAEYGSTATLENMLKDSELYLYYASEKYLNKKIKGNKNYRKELFWQKKGYRHFWWLMKFHGGRHLYSVNTGYFTDRGAYKVSFLKLRKHLGFFQKRFSFCAEPKNVLGYITDEACSGNPQSWDLDDGCSILPLDKPYIKKRKEKDNYENVKAIWNYCRDFFKDLYSHKTDRYHDEGYRGCIDKFKKYGAVPAYEDFYGITPKESYNLMLPYMALIEEYSLMGKGMKAVMKKKNKKNRLFRLFIQKDTLEKEIEVDEENRYPSYSKYDEGNRINTKFRLKNAEAERNEMERWERMSRSYYGSGLKL